ncbi:hypothetical protein KPL76_07110 [Subtercola sp. PAMC28395]|uniref:hypothetical protein n=1 Tax=Subtercola sp. PAMC28395 TaxID=2846775 RepID=UPI001C0E597A|nr:hypothetical protein [Subtercola sp. PAMC28395]QWT25105.1 hypothetical protein KPL76_07110 [Subtercola sp. PAMC28395]
MEGKSRLTRRVLFFGAVATLFVVLAYIIWAISSTSAVFQKSSGNKTTGSLVVLALPQQSGAAWGWVYSDGSLDPEHTDTVVLRFAVSTTIPSTGTESSAAFVLSGPIARNVGTCYGDGLTWSEKLSSYSALTDFQKASVLDSLQFSSTTGLTDDSEDGRIMSESDARNQAEGRSYSVLVPTVYLPDQRTFVGTSAVDATQSVNRTLNSFETQFTCSIKPEAFWSSQGDQQIFTFPSLFTETGFSGGDSSLYIDRKIVLKYDRADPLQFSSQKPDYGSTGLTTFEGSWEAWNTQPSAPHDRMSLNQFQATYQKADAQNQRDLQLLFLGLAFATCATLLIAILKHLADWTSDRVVSWWPQARKGKDG